VSWLRWGKRRDHPPEPTTDHQGGGDLTSHYVIELYVGGDGGALFRARLNELARLCELAGGHMELTTIDGRPAGSGYIGCRVYRLTPHRWEVDAWGDVGRPSSRPRFSSSAATQPPTDPPD
jgi:hypothetical protein